MKKKMLALMLTGIMVMAMLAGCGTQKTQKEESKTEESKTEEIDYSDVEFRVAWWGGEARNTNTMAFIEEFEKLYPGLKVEVEFNGNFNDYFTSMNTQAAGLLFLS